MEKKGSELGKELLAKRVAKDVLKSDDTIKGVIVVDDNARLLSVESSDHDQGTRGMSGMNQNSLENFAALIKLFLEAAKTASFELGGMQFIIGAFKGANVLLMDLPEYKFSLGIYLVRSANAETIYYKVKDTLASEP